MNYIKHLTHFFQIVDHDTRLSPYHISLYLALFRRWNMNFFNNPVSIARDEIMNMSKIGSTNTYIKCLKELTTWKYIKYMPSHNRHKASLVYMFTFDKTYDNTSETEVSPLINNINTVNKTNFFEQDQKKIKVENSMNNLISNIKAKKKNNNRSDFPPCKDHVLIYFSEKGIAEIEAEKFYNHFESTGWLVGGRAKMKDWKAAARNWILNIPKFQSRKNNYKDRATNLNQAKNYNEPL